ncbi:MAG: GldL-related protein [Lacibacter sp.]|jgi:hypothetical protein
MKWKALITVSFVSSLFITITGAYLKITHTNGADAVLGIGLLATLIFVMAGLYEVWSSSRIQHAEKVMWTFGFLFMSSITGFIYLLYGRKRIAAIQ